MSFTAFDPVVNIISQIGYSFDVDHDGNDESCVSFSYPDGEYKGDTCYVPLYTSDEARTGELPYMPFIEVLLVDAPSRTHNVQGDIKFGEAYIDFNIHVVNTDEINKIKTWLPVCKNELCDLITQNRHVVSGCTWMEVIDNGRAYTEAAGKQIIFHHVISIYANEYDNGI